MKVREIHVSDSDKRSAEIFFDALLKFWDLREGSALDAFARNGQLTLACYANRVAQATAWELGAEHREQLERFPLYDLQIGCSYGMARACEDRFDLVVIDTPQGAHKDSMGQVHFEHFDFFRTTLQQLLKDRGVIVVYVNKEPYDKNEVGSHGYDEYEEYDFRAWLRARSDFYNLGCRSKLEEGEALEAYRSLVEFEGYRVKNTLIVPCFSDVPGKEPYSFRLAMEVKKEK
jgi:16S rRNA G966 N2-methylase RsmD